MTQTEALLEIAKRNGGVITPGAVIDEARNPASVLHGAFTWDDRKAAERWRVYEAQNLIRRCTITVEKGGREIDTYAFVGLSTDRNEDAASNPYRLASDVARSEDLLAIAERDAISQLKALEARYKHLRRLDSIWSAIDAAGKVK